MVEEEGEGGCNGAKEKQSERVVGGGVGKKRKRRRRGKRKGRGGGGGNKEIKTGIIRLLMHSQVELRGGFVDSYFG